MLRKRRPSRITVITRKAMSAVLLKKETRKRSRKVAMIVKSRWLIRNRLESIVTSGFHAWTSVCAAS